jgi:DinB superfamily
MITETSGKNELLTAIDETISQLQGLMSSLDEKKINTVPFKDSWTAGQLFRHVTKSITGMAKAMSAKAKPANRGAGEKIPELKKAFLDFSTKMKSPEFVVPEDGPYEKQGTIAELNKSFGLLKENTINATLTDLVEGLPLGAVTKLEILHFILYHTQRHLHQMKNIVEVLRNN